jgi:hypothetical protein
MLQFTLLDTLFLRASSWQRSLAHRFLSTMTVWKLPSSL